MRTLGVIALGLLLHNVAPAQINNLDTPSATESADSDARRTGVVGSAAATTAPEYTPMTSSERWRYYILSAFGPGAIARAAAVGGISQWKDNPKEWGGGGEAYGERFGTAFAEHIIRKTLEAGSSAALHRDTRYFRSTDSGFFKRTKHAVVSAFLVRNEAGAEQFAYTRIGAAAGASFISRIWQPRSEDTSGDAAVNFGITMAAYAGWNVVKEFAPRHLKKH